MRPSRCSAIRRPRASSSRRAAGISARRHRHATSSLGLRADLQGLKLVIAPGDGDSFLRDDHRRQAGRRSTFRSASSGAGERHPVQGQRGVRGDAASAPAAWTASRRRRDDRLAAAIGRPAAQPSRAWPPAFRASSDRSQFMVHGIGLDTDVVFEPGNAGPFDIAPWFQAAERHRPRRSTAAASPAAASSSSMRPRASIRAASTCMFEDTHRHHARSASSPRRCRTARRLLAADPDRVRLSRRSSCRSGSRCSASADCSASTARVDRDALDGGLRDGSLDSILFPTDVVANAARIISDLQPRVPAAAPGTFLFGPMAKLGWGDADRSSRSSSA